MVMLEAVGEFFLIEWIWSVTLGALQVVLTPCFMTLLFIFVTRVRFLKASVLAVSATVLSFLLYSIFVGVALYLLGHMPEKITFEYAAVHANWRVIIGFGLSGIYSVIQLGLFRLYRTWYDAIFPTVTWVVVISNFLAACITRTFTNI